MFNLEKSENDDASRADEADDEAGEPVTVLPAEKDGVPAVSSPGVNSPEEPSRLPDIASRKGGRRDQPVSDEARELVIGQGIALNGEINSCDLLVVEGKVEATMKDCSEIKITETGTFKGQVEFDRADISGVFEGDLTAREHLVVRATGRVTGKVRFGELEIERGGQVIGDLQVFGEAGNAVQHAQGAFNEQAK